MEAFEVIRDSAARLHSEIVSAGVDPLKPMVLVEAALSRFDLKLFWLTPCDPALKGARAVFDDQSGSIFCEETTDVGERALLIGHEIGHVRVHAAASWCDAHDIDPSRSTEAAPVGLQRVEDYGVRERRELQANVFAREFLFPRAWARQLYLENGLGAGTIAQTTGLPKNLIRQQLFDALLLPAAPAEASESVLKQTVKPDPSQTRAAAHRGSPFQLQAGPGTGKTRTLVDRVTSLIGEGIDPSAILVLTFSNRAAGELAERIAAVAPEAAPRVWIGTFHAFGLDLVRRYHDRLGLPPDPTLFDRSDAVEVLEEILPTLPLVHYRNLWDPALVLRDILSAISRAKDEMADPARYRALAQTMAERARDEEAREAAEKCLEVAHVYDLYEKAMHDRGSVDFGDLIMRPALLLESDPSVQVALRLRHRHILVDEYQDVNRASARLLKGIAGDGKHLWVVGDSRQSIYRFRGASSSNMALFASDYPNAASDQLSVNYRSTRQVVSTFLGVAAHMGASAGMLPLALSAERGEGPANPEIRRFDTLENEVEGLAASIREVEARGVPLRDQAVLCRTNGRLNEIAEALEARGIPVLHLGSLFERDEVRDLLALLTLAVDRFGTGLTRVGATERYDLSLQDVFLVISRLKEQAERPALNSLSALATTAGLSKAGAEGFARLARDLEGLSSSLSAWEFLAEYLLDRAELIREMARRDSVPDRMRSVAIWQFLNFVREQSPVSSGPRIQRTLDRVRQLVLLAEERDLRQVPTGALHMNAVRLMTVHGSKGLEFEAVHVPGLTAASFPSSNRGQRCPPPVGMIEGADGLTVAEEARQSHEHEEQCLFFVALSRARTYLRLYLARLQPNGKNRSPSVFLEWVPTQVVVEISAPKKMALPGGVGKVSTVRVTLTADSSITDSSLSAYQKCPRRYFYTHVLGLGTARKSTAFLRTHNCLYDLIRWLAEVRRGGDTTVEAAEQAFESIWKDRGPVDHGFAADYRHLASRLITALVSSGAGRRFRDAEPIGIDFPNGRIIVEPNEMAQLPNGTVVLRRLRTGHKRSDEYDNLEYTLYHLAGKARFGNAFAVEAIHLTDETVETVTITAQKVNNRRATSDALLKSIGQGVFTPEVDAVSCPRCPHFFICDAMPKGPLQVP